MNHTLFLIAGYGVSWVGIIAYFLYLRRREKHVIREIRNREGFTE